MSPHIGEVVERYSKDRSKTNVRCSANKVRHVYLPVSTSFRVMDKNKSKTKRQISRQLGLPTASAPLTIGYTKCKIAHRESQRGYTKTREGAAPRLHKDTVASREYQEPRATSQYCSVDNSLLRRGKTAKAEPTIV